MKCTYCSIEADTLDHVIPRSYSYNQSYAKKYVVPACKQCNSTLSDKCHLTIADRAAYLLRRYKQKHKKEMNSPLWTEEEISELGYNLQSEVRAAQYNRELWAIRMEHLQLISESNLQIEDCWSDISME